MQHDAPLVVLLVAEPARDSLYLLDHPVVAFGPGVGDAGLQEPFDLGPPLHDGGGESGRLSHVRGDAVTAALTFTRSRPINLDRGRS